MPDADKIKENLLRRKADRRGLRLSKSRTRDRYGCDYGLYAVFDTETGGTVHPTHNWPYALSLEEAELYIMTDEEYEAHKQKQLNAVA